MNLLTRAAEIVGLKRSFSREVAPVKEAAMTPSPSEWADDGVLRKLAADYDAGLTGWVLASDMLKLFKKLDGFNEERASRDKICIRVSASATDYLSCVIKRQAHLTPEAKGEKWESLDLMRDIGPQGIGPEHLLIQQGGKAARAYYHAGALNTNLNIETPNGWVKFEFGMADGLFGNAPASASPPALK